MYQPSHFSTEIGRMRAEEMRARAERYRTIQKAKQHKKEESEEEEESLSPSRSLVYRKALGAVGLSLLMIVILASAALAMPADPPSGFGGGDDAAVSQPQVREGPSSVWEAESKASQPVTDVDPAPSTPASSNGDTELVIAIASILALTAFGGLMWSRRQTIKTA
jgi:hypothetical protein